MEILGHEQQTMQAALRVRSARAEILAGNVANVDTPGYVSRDIAFDRALTQAIDSDSGNNLPNTDAIVRENVRFDHNDSDLGSELGKSYENAVDYAATLKLYGDSVGRLTTASSGS